MDFNKAANAATVAERNKLINEEVENSLFYFGDIIASNGMDGWPEVEGLEKVTIAEDDENNQIVIQASINGTETVPGACKDAPSTYSFSSTIEIKICSEDGMVVDEEAINYDSDKGSWEDDEDYYPGDYI